MRPSDGLPPDPHMLDELEAIDATLLGLAVDPAHAELAELTLLLAGERPQMTDAFARELDARVERRFAGSSADARSNIRRPRRRLLLGSSVFGGGVAVAAAVVIAIVVISGGGGQTNPAGFGGVSAGASAGSTSNSTATGSTSHPTVTGSTSHPTVTGSTSHPPATGPTSHSPATGNAQSGAVSRKLSKHAAAGTSAPETAPVPSRIAPSLPAAAAAPSTAAAPASPAPTPNGRATTQSAQLTLTAASSRIDTVAEEVFRVVGQENGIVKSSSVTAGGDAYATFSLSIPSGNLQETMTQLSQLQYSSVSSRTDSTQDVNDQYLNDERALADARALRTSLLKQLASAGTQAAIDSLTAQLHDAEASIASDEATLNTLQGKINFSPLSLQINSGQVVPPLPKPVESGGFTLHTAAHDAVRVLTVVAGGALIALAALLPVALLIALGLWIAHSLRRRRREAALDSA